MTVDMCNLRLKLNFLFQVDKNDIEIRIFDENGWECFVQFKPSDVHYQVAITFFTPEYKAHEIIQPVNVS